MKKSIVLTSLFVAICYLPLHADMTEDLMRGAFVEGITADLREPQFCEGVLTTQQGGVITGPGIRIQARELTYTRKMINKVPVCTLVAEGDIMLEFGDYLFVGDYLEYDFQTRSGAIYMARTSVDAWYVGGEIIELRPDGSYRLHNSFLTTSETTDINWQLTAEEAELYEGVCFKATRVQLRLFNRTILCLPRINLDLDSVFDHPIRYSIGWWGRQGPRVGLAYELFSWNRWKMLVRADYRATRGPGAGIETHYHSEDHKLYFESITYAARDSATLNPSEPWRYRFQGVYSHQFNDDRTTIDLSYDKLSDKYMATDYADLSLDIEEADRTQLDICHQADWWIAHLLARPRINNFETIKQDLPTFRNSWHPFEIGETGIISDNQVQASYLDFAYAHNLIDVHDFNAVRVELSNTVYRPFVFGGINATPEAGINTIFYGNSPGGEARWALTGIAGIDLNAPLYRFYPNFKHVIVPYARYQYYTFPTSPPNDHYIFDIDDGWYRLNMFTFGVNQSFYTKDFRGCVKRILHIDLHANAFPSTPTIPRGIPKVYSRIVFNTFSNVRHTLDTAWDFEENQLDHVNIWTQWTINSNLAFALEFRHRDAFDWRKVDRDNFVLDSFRSVEELRHSLLSDRRDTVLFHTFYRFHPRWSIEFQSRIGWRKFRHERYTEFEVDLTSNLSSAWQVRLSYQHKESEERFSVYFSFGLQRPDRFKSTDEVPLLDFY